MSQKITRGKIGTHFSGGVWQVEGIVSRVIDGDTFEVMCDLGFKIYLEITVRLNGIDAPETSTNAGVEAILFAENLLPVDTRVIVTSRQLDKYGRAVADVVLRDTGASVAERMVSVGHAQNRTF